MSDQTSTLCHEIYCAKNTPVGDTVTPTIKSEGTKVTLMPSDQKAYVKTIRVWEKLLSDRRGDGILGISVTWTNDEEKCAGRCEGLATKKFDFEKGEKIQILYVYADDRVDGFWFVTDAQKSFFPGKSSTRYDMTNLGNGILVGLEGIVAADEMGFSSLGANFRQIT